MAPKAKAESGKKESGKAKKAGDEGKKAPAAAATTEKKEVDWEEGAKTKKSKDVEREEKKKADAAKKAEIARLLAEEEAALAVTKPKTAPSKTKKKAGYTPAGPGAIVAGGAATEEGAPKDAGAADVPRDEQPEEFSATGIDDALDLMSLVTAKIDKASVGQAAAGIEKHPERRLKAAFEAYKERELPELKEDQPGLRLQQYTEILFKKFQKSPDNPLNQVVVAYDATQEEKVDALKKQKEITANRLRQTAQT